VVIAQIATFRGGQQSFAKVTNVTSGSFKVSTAEFEYLDGSHAVETINYVVVEAGTYALATGKKLIAGTKSISTTFDGSPNFTTVGAGTSNYQLFTQVQSSNSSQMVTTRAAKSSSSFTVSLMVQESSRNAGNTIQGTVGYLVIGQ
jgi:hypothetical protein